MGRKLSILFLGQRAIPSTSARLAAGSTGGGSVAVACGMVPLADGSDLGGSLRNPPNFCGVVGLRPSPGRLPNPPANLAWQPFSVEGPVARSVKDCAFFLSVLAGPDERIPISIEQPGSAFAQRLEGRNFQGVRVAIFRDMGLPWNPEVKEAIRAQGKVFESLGCVVEEAEPDFRDSNECFLAWRHWMMESKFGDLLDTKGDQLNEYVHWHVEEGRKLTGPYLSGVEIKRSALYQRVREFMDRYEFFVLPVNQVLPFDVTQHYPTEINGVKMENYLAWMKSAYYISTIGNPAASVPCAFSKGGLPIGIQIVGRHHDDWGALQMAHAFEQARNLESEGPWRWTEIPDTGIHAHCARLEAESIGVASFARSSRRLAWRWEHVVIWRGHTAHRPCGLAIGIDSGPCCSCRVGVAEVVRFLPCFHSFVFIS